MASNQRRPVAPSPLPLSPAVGNMHNSDNGERKLFDLLAATEVCARSWQGHRERGRERERVQDERTRASIMSHTRQPVVNKDKGRDWLHVCRTGELSDGTEGCWGMEGGGQPMRSSAS